MKLEVIRHPDPRLRETAKTVEHQDETIRHLMANMRDTLVAENALGLAAPQVGVPLRVIVIRADAQPDGMLLSFVNPTIESREGSQWVQEGCLSVPEMVGAVERAQVVRIKAMSLSSKHAGQYIREYVARGLEAAVLQHEIDHLDGVLFIDRIDRERLRVESASPLKRLIEGG